MIVVFYEDNEQFVVRALDGVEQRWQEEVKKQHLNIWLKQAADARRLRRQDTLLLVAPETALVRRIIMLPSQTKPTQQRAMAANALTAELKEQPAALAVQMLDAEGRCAVCGCMEKKQRSLTAPFGRFARRLRIVGAADLAAAQLPDLADGWYQFSAVLWNAIIAVQNGRVIDARADNSVDALTLKKNLSAAHHELGLAEPTSMSVLRLEMTQECDSVRLLACALRPLHAQTAVSLREDRPLAALLLLCVLLPGVLLIGLALRPAEIDDAPQQAQPQNVVERSTYGVLLTEAYAVKDERITLLGQDAIDDTLALSGRCAEALDLAAYMRALAEVEPDLHPLLLEMTRTSEDEQTFYEFVVQISLEGGDAS